MKRALAVCGIVFSVSTAFARTVTVFPTIVRMPDAVSLDPKSRDAIAERLSTRFSVKREDRELTFDAPPDLPQAQLLERGIAELGNQIRGTPHEGDYDVLAEYVVRRTASGGEAIAGIQIYIFGRDGEDYGSRAIGTDNPQFRAAKLEVQSSRQRERLLSRTNTVAAWAASASLADRIVREKANAPSAVETRDWETAWADAFERARSERKLVFVDFWAAWCAPCRRMEAQTFRDPEVRDRLSRFVFVKLNYDEVKGEKLFSIPGLPWYSIRDPWGRQVVAYMSFFDAPIFAQYLDQVLSAAPDLIEIGDALHTKETASGFMRLGAVFDRMKSAGDARNAYARAAALAEGENDPQLAQQALIEAAVIRIRQGTIREALDELRVLSAAPANAECEAAIWLAIGFGEQKRQKSAEARKAYERALTAAPEQSALRAQIERQLAALAK